MHYFALLLSPEADLAARSRGPSRRDGGLPGLSTPRPHRRSAPATRCNRRPTGVRITGGPDAPTVTDGPFAEGAEVAGGYYVFEAENLDEALALARDIPAAKYGAVEVWPMVDLSAARAQLDGQQLAGPAAGASRSVGHAGIPGVGRGHRGSTSSSASGGGRPHRWAARRCTRRRRRRRFGFATARCCSPTGPSPRAPRSPTGSTCITPPIVTRRSRWRR